MDARNVFEAICAGFNATPSACAAEGKETKRGVSKGTVIAIIVTAIIINMLLIYCYR